jgi:hypothetical protein
MEYKWTKPPLLIAGWPQVIPQGKGHLKESAVFLLLEEIRMSLSN